MISLSATGSLLICITLFFCSVKEKKKKVEVENLLQFPMLQKTPWLCIHSFTGWLEAFSFLLPIKKNIKTNYSLGSLSWDGWQALDFLSAAGWESCPTAAEHIHQHPGRGMAVEMGSGEGRAGLDMGRVQHAHWPVQCSWKHRPFYFCPVFSYT